MRSQFLFAWLAAGIIEDYIDNCQDRGLAPKTVRWYRWHLERAAGWLAEQPGFVACDIVTDAGLLAYYRSCRHLAVSTRRNLVSAFRAFGGWLVRWHGYPENPAARLERPGKEQVLPRVVMPTDLARLLGELPTMTPRERALVLLILDGGLRVGECARLQRAHIELERQRLTVYAGKGHKDRVVYYFEHTAQALADYLASHDHAFVFVSEYVGRPPAPMTPSGLRQILKRLARDHRYPDLRPHTLRRTCGTEILANGGDLSSVADHLGHEDVETARIYARLEDHRRQEVLRRASPVERGLERAPMLVENWPVRDDEDGEAVD